MVSAALERPQRGMAMTDINLAQRLEGELKAARAQIRADIYDRVASGPRGTATRIAEERGVSIQRISQIVQTERARRQREGVE